MSYTSFIFGGLKYLTCFYNNVFYNDLQATRGDIGLFQLFISIHSKKAAADDPLLPFSTVYFSILLFLRQLLYNVRFLSDDAAVHKQKKALRDFFQY